MSQSMISNMVKKSLAFLIALAFIGSSLSVPSFAAVKAGATCKKVGAFSTFEGKKFTCLKSGSKLLWSKGVIVRKPVQTTQGIANALPSQPSSDVSLCKINEISSNRPRFENSLPTGFPRATFPFATKTGTVKWALVPIDFSDIKGEPNFRSRVDTQMNLLSEWFDTVSEGKFKVEWVVAKNWTTLPGLQSSGEKQLLNQIRILTTQIFKP